MSSVVRGVSLSMSLLFAVQFAQASDREIPSSPSEPPRVSISLSGEWKDSDSAPIRYRVKLLNSGKEFTGTAMLENDRDVGPLQVQGVYTRTGFRAEVLRAGELITTVDGTFDGAAFVAVAESVDDKGRVTARRTGVGNWDMDSVVAEPAAAQKTAGD